MEKDVLSGETEVPSPVLPGDAFGLSELTEDAALALLKKADLQPAVLEKLSKSSSLMKSRKVKLALVQHLRTPRHVLLPLLRHLFTFDLMRVALMPAVSAEAKIAAEESLIHRLEKLSLGEKLSLAKRSSGRVASALLHDPDPGVVDTALKNGRLTESAVLRELMKRNAGPHLAHTISAHPKWGLRQEVRTALSKENTSGQPSEVSETEKD